MGIAPKINYINFCSYHVPLGVAPQNHFSWNGKLCKDLFLEKPDKQAFVFYYTDNKKKMQNQK